MAESNLTAESQTISYKGQTLDIEKLLKLQARDERRIQQRNEWFKTEEGKAYQRANAKRWYERNREKKIADVKERYHFKKECKQIFDSL